MTPASTTPADLEGKRFGITTAGSSFHYMAHKIADGEGFPRATPSSWSRSTPCRPSSRR